MIIGTGGFGTECAVGVSEKIDNDLLVLADSRDQVTAVVKEYELDATVYTVNYGTMGGAHRDWRTAMKQAKNDKALKKMIEEVTEVAKELYPQVPIVCWGLGGATGYTTAYYLCQRLPYAVHVVTLPHDKLESDPKIVYQNAADQLSLISNTKEFKYHPIIVNQYKIDAVNVGEHVGELIEANRVRYSKVCSNMAVRRINGNAIKVVNVVDGNELKITKIEELIRRLRHTAENMDHNIGDIKLRIKQQQKKLGKKPEGFIVENNNDKDDFFSDLM